MDCNEGDDSAPAGGTSLSDTAFSDGLAAYLAIRDMVHMSKGSDWGRYSRAGRSLPPIGYVVDKTRSSGWAFQWNKEKGDGNGVREKDEDVRGEWLDRDYYEEMPVFTRAQETLEVSRCGKMALDVDTLRDIIDKGLGAGAAEALLLARRAIRKGECYYVEGAVDAIDDVEVLDGTEWKRVAFFTHAPAVRPPAEVLAELCVAAREAPFGDLRTMQTVIDSTVRVAFEIREGSFRVDERVMDEWRTQIAKEIEATLMGGARGVTLKPYRLNVYGQGGFFKPHVDTPVGGSMLGTVVLALPVLHEGGDLVVHGRTPVAFESNSTTARHKLRWCAFFGDCVHEVAPVKEGARVTLTFLILPREDTDRPVCQAPASSDTFVLTAGRPSEERARMLRAVVADACAFLGGFFSGTIGLLLDHSYTLSALCAAGDHMCLKGVDRELYRALQEAADSRYGERPRLALLPVVQHRSETRNPEYPFEIMTCSNMVYSCTEADIMYVGGLSKVEPARPHELDYKKVPFFEDGLSKDAGRKGRVIDLDYTGAEYTGNGMEPSMCDGVYFRGAIIATYAKRA